MPIVQLQDGTKLKFDRMPPPQEVEFAYQRIQAEKARAAQMASSASTDKGTFGNVAEKVASFTGGKKIGQGIGQALAYSKNAKGLEETQAQQFDLQNRLISKIKEKKASGEDTSRLKNALDILMDEIGATGENAGSVLNPNNLTAKEVVGDALQLGATVASAGTFGQAAKGANAGKAVFTGAEGVAANAAIPTAVTNVIPKGPGFWSGLGKGVAKGAGEGAAFGAVEGVASGLKNNEDAAGVLQSGLAGAGIGAAGGGIIGGVIGGTGAALRGRALNKEVIAAQEASGIRPTLSGTVAEKIKSNPSFKTLVDEAKKQGFDEKEINFLSTVSEADKPVLKKMFDVTARAKTEPRQIQRAADILGDNATAIVRQVEKQNREFGKAVDTTAKALKGQVVDATPVRERALSLLEDAGVTSNADGTPNWDNSIFSKTPELQSRLMKNLSDLPAGEMDAYDLHKFKKSIDEVVEYGVNGEGYKGRAEGILKAIRKEADGVLDTNFEDYNLANTEFKNTRDILDEVRDVVGYKVDFSSKASGQAFGQRFRSAFSNNTSRGRTLQLVETLQNVASERNLTGKEQSLLDQALYVNMLEDTFGSQAATGLASEVRKGVEAVKKGVDAFRDPIKGAGSLAVDLYEKSRNISDEMKQDILQKFLAQAGDAKTPTEVERLADALKSLVSVNISGDVKRIPKK